MIMRLSALAIAALLTSAAAVAAQSSRIHGVVVDAQERPVPGVTVTVTGPTTDVTATTDGSGTFTIDVPMPGRYDVRAELSGFAVETGTVTAEAGATANATLLKRTTYTE